MPSRVTLQNVKPFNQSWKKLKEEGHEDKFKSALKDLNDDALLIDNDVFDPNDCRELYKRYKRVADFLLKYTIAVRLGGLMYARLKLVNRYLHEHCKDKVPHFKLIKILAIAGNASVVNFKSTGEKIAPVEERRENHEYLE